MIILPIYDNFEGGARRKNAIFCSKVFKNCIKTPFLACFLKKLTAAQKIWSKLGLYSYLGELKKINLVDLKKEVEKSFLKIREFFENHFFFENPPPLEEFLDPRLRETVIKKTTKTSLKNNDV